MTTTTTLARGHELSRGYIAEGWTNYTNEPSLYRHPRYEQLIAALVKATETEADKLLPGTAQIFPNLGEVIGEVGTDLGDDFDAVDLIERATAAVDYAAIEAEVIGEIA